MDDLKQLQYCLFDLPCDISVEQSLKHTFGHVECPACDATRARMMFDPDKLRRLNFSAASDLWLESRKPYLRPRTFYLYGQHVKHLQAFFGKQVLYKIHIGHIREFQKARLVNADGQWPKKAGPSLINHELSALQQILKRADEWKKIDLHYEPLPLPSWRPPKVMSDEEEMRLFSVAASNPDWQIAYWVASITNNTGASGTELRNLRYEDVHLEARIPCFRVDSETAKNEFRGRMVAMNQTAKKQMERCMERGRKLGSGKPQHYIFPFREAPGRWDPTRPTTDAWLRRSFKLMREAAGIAWLTPHCLRHQHITLRYEAGESEQTIALGVGHQSPRMTRHYSSLRRETQKNAVDAIDPSRRFGIRSVTGAVKTGTA